MVSSQKGSTPILMQNCVHDSKEVSIATKNQSIMYIVHTTESLQWTFDLILQKGPLYIFRGPWLIAT